MSAPPNRKTRRRLAYWMASVVTVVVVWMLLPGDVHPLEQALAMVIVPSMITGIIAFMSGETYSDHSSRRHGDKND